MNKPIVFIVFMMLMGFSFDASASKERTINTDIFLPIYCNSISNSTSIPHLIFIDSSKTNIINQRKERFVSALLAFPFPFGFVGAHRVMLGTKPWIPLVYVATFGGGFGLLPLIDFCVITFSKDIEQYENNPRLFMWIKESTDN